mgnify:CR=1 FL=1|tara:strand:+ start:642 stop:1430 length:789 start_codon:yes stop_codon:yes gene_type:complete
MSGYVYAVTNPSIPGLVKIGRTANLNRRMDSLFCSSVPHPFKCEAVQEVEDPNAVEATLHGYLSGCRVSSKREFFKVDVEQVKKLFDLVGAGVKPKAKAEQHDGLTIEVDNHKLYGKDLTDLYNQISTALFSETGSNPMLKKAPYSPDHSGLTKYSTVNSRKSKKWTLEQAFGFKVPPNYTKVHVRWIEEHGFDYYPEKPTEDGNRVPLVAHRENRVYLSQVDFAKEHGIPADYVSDKLKSPCGFMAHEIIEMYKKEETCQQ